MARITEATRELLRKKILEKAQHKRNALAGVVKELSDSLDTEEKRYKAQAIDLIKKEFEFFNAKVTRIIENHGLKWQRQYASYDYTVKEMIVVNNGKAYINDDAGYTMERVKDSKDTAVKRLDKARADLEKLDGKLRKACEDIELRVALGAKFDEVVELINNLQF